MAEPLMDFQCYVGKYEIKRKDELPSWSKAELHLMPPNIPQLVEVGPLKLVRPSREAFERAVKLLLTTRMPKWEKTWGLWEDKRFYEHINCGEIDLDPKEFSWLTRIVRAIAPHFGMLGASSRKFEGSPDRPRHQDLHDWSYFASRIQAMFGVREAMQGLAKDGEKDVGHLSICLSFKAGKASIRIRPRDNADALIYYAAQMIAQGTTAQTCKRCGTPFLEGGERVDNKRRGGARFCSDKCRYAFHYDVRRKKAKL